MNFNYQVLFNVCWGLSSLEPLYTYARACGVMGSALCLILKESCCWVRDLPSQGFIKWPWSQHKHVWYNAKDCVSYFSPSFPILHSPVFSSVQASGIMAGGSWTGHQYNFYPMSVGYWLKSIALPQFTSTKYLVLLESAWQMALFLLHFPTLSNLQGHPKFIHGLPPTQGPTGLWKL